VSKQQGHAMRYFHKFAIAASLLAVLATATPSAAATFDGDWNVQITSSNIERFPPDVNQFMRGGFPSCCKSDSVGYH